MGHCDWCWALPNSSTENSSLLLVYPTQSNLVPIFPNVLAACLTTAPHAANTVLLPLSSLTSTPNLHPLATSYDATSLSNIPIQSSPPATDYKDMHEPTCHVGSVASQYTTSTIFLSPTHVGTWFKKKKKRNWEEACNHEKNVKLGAKQSWIHIPVLALTSYASIGQTFNLYLTSLHFSFLPCKMTIRIPNVLGWWKV